MDNAIEQLSEAPIERIITSNTVLTNPKEYVCLLIVDVERNRITRNLRD